MRLLMLFFSMMIAGTMQAQNITGVVTDDSGSPLPGATVALVKAGDSTIVKLALSNNDGTYSFKDIENGSYRLNITHVGYNEKFSEQFDVNGAAVSAPPVTLSKTSADLQGVVVSARKPIIQVQADKTILNVEGTINAAGSDALELLRKSPGVTVDRDENLSVQGKNGVQVYIDGRPTPLAGADLANYLKSMQSSQVEAIEIITNPSAKYDAAGNAGIINIRLKKNKAFGTNGSAGAGYAIGRFPKYNASFNLNHRNRNINVYGTYSFNKGENHTTIELYRTVLDTLFDQSGFFRNDNLSHNLKVGADYSVSKNATVGLLVDGSIADPDMTNYSRTPISYIPTGKVDRILVADNSSEMGRGNYNVNLNYTFNKGSDKSFIINADKGYFNISNDQFQPNYYFQPDGKTPISSAIYRMIAPSDINIQSLKVDYEQNFKGGKLGFGGKFSFVNTDNDFRRYTVTNSGEELDRDRSNRFDYKENINAAYVNWNKGYQEVGVMIQAGLRIENTNNEGLSTGQKLVGSVYQPYNESFERNYTNLFPSASVTFNKNPMNQWSVTYSRRIDRPAYQDLNPFEFKLDEYTFMKGNTQLRPQYTNSFGLTNVFKYRLTTTLNYSHITDLFTQIVDTAEKTKSFLSKRNLATQDVVSLNVSYPMQYKSYSLFANMNANYSQFKADFGTGRKIDLSAAGLTFYAQNSIRFAKTWTAELSGVFIAPTIFQGTFKSKAMGGVDLGLQKQIMGGNGTIKIAGTDIFRTFRFAGSSDFAGQVTNVVARWEAQQFKINFNWRFGSTTVKAAKQKSTASEDELKRVQQQQGGIGIGQ